MGENNKTERVWETMEELIERIDRMLEVLKGSERKRKLSEEREERWAIIRQLLERAKSEIMKERDEEKEER